MRPGARISIVWKFFKKDTDTRFIICNICKKRIKFFGNTTNLKQHLARLHPLQLRGEATGEVAANIDAGRSQPDPSVGQSLQHILSTYTDRAVAGTSAPTEERNLEKLPEPSPSETPNKKCPSNNDAMDTTFADYFEAKKNRTLIKSDHASLDSNTEGSKMFLLSVLSDLQKMTDQEVRWFKRKTLDAVDDIFTARTTISPQIAHLSGSRTPSYALKEMEKETSHNVQNLASSLDDNETEVQFIEEIPSANQKHGSKQMRCDESPTTNDEILLKKTERSADEYQVFGDYIASEFRLLKSDRSIALFRRKIQRAILEVSEIDDLTESSVSRTHSPLTPKTEAHEEQMLGTTWE